MPVTEIALLQAERRVLLGEKRVARQLAQLDATEKLGNPASIEHAHRMLDVFEACAEVAREALRGERQMAGIAPNTVFPYDLIETVLMRSENLAAQPVKAR